MKKVKEIIVVEGKCDINAVKRAVDATIFQTYGFGIFSDKEKLDLFKKLAEKRGIVILTDSDGAGFLIRNYLKGALPKECVKQAYIPDVFGKEARKKQPSAEGKLGVEAMDSDVILSSLSNAGATFEDEEVSDGKAGGDIKKSDLYTMGLSGGKNSTEKRAKLLKRFSLPERLSVNAMTDILNMITCLTELEKIIAEMEEANPVEK